MRTLTHFFALTVVLCTSTAALGEELESGVPVGRTMLSMPIEKIAGTEDGVKPGEVICYT